MPIKTVIIEWEDVEERPAKHPHLILGIALFGLILVIVALVLKNFLFALIVAVAAGVIMFSARQTKPRSRYALTKEGIIFDDEFFPYDNLHSFSLKEHNNNWRLKVRTGRTFLPFLLLPLGHEEFASEVRTILLDFLEEGRHDETLAELVSDLLE